MTTGRQSAQIFKAKSTSSSAPTTPFNWTEQRTVYDTIFAGDGVASIAEARKQIPDLMILDLGLPAGDGFSVLERMKANEKLSAIPVILLSGRDRVNNRDRALKAGAKTFLQKPIANDKLLAVIRMVLEAKEQGAPVVYDLPGPNTEA